MSTLNGQWLELFRAGDYGNKGSYSAADIDSMIANYNPATHEAPIVMGHPEHDAPAFGWIDQLKRDGDTLLGMPRQVPADFEELVKTGRFKKRSISFYRTASGPALRHVGFLGAMPPEVKGLADAKFSSADFEAIEFKEEQGMTPEDVKKSFMESLKEFFSEMLPKKAANTGTDQEAIDKAVAAVTTRFESKFTELQTSLDAEKKAREKAEQSAATGAQSSFAEKQIARVKTAKRWVPAFDKMGLPQIFTELAKNETVISFGEGDKKTEKKPAELLADFMISLSEIVPTGELAAGAQKTSSGKLVQFNEPANANFAVDEESVALAEAAQELATKEKISFGDALKRVRRQGVGPGGTAANQA